MFEPDTGSQEEEEEEEELFVQDHIQVETSKLVSFNNTEITSTNCQDGFLTYFS